MLFKGNSTSLQLIIEKLQSSKESTNQKGKYIIISVSIQVYCKIYYIIILLTYHSHIAWNCFTTTLQ